MRPGELTLKDVQIFKCFAILMIALHNFLHSFPTPSQNEFTYQRVFFDQFIEIFYKTPEMIVQGVFSYLGHFGVQVFIIISAYGLTLSHYNAKQYYGRFVVSRMKKIYPAFLLAILAWLCLRVLWLLLQDDFSVARLELPAIALKLLLLSSFIPGYELEPVGPWWFIPFIFQFYLLFPLLSSLHQRYGNLALLAISAVGILAGYSADLVPFGIYYTVLPHLPVICFGIYLACNPQFELSKSLLLCCLIVFVLGNFFEVFFVFTHITAGLLFLALFVYLKNCLTQGSFIEKAVLFIGQISLQIFLVNGFCRTPMFEWALADGRWPVVYMYTLVFLLVTLLLSVTLYYVEIFLKKVFFRRPVSF